MPTFEEMWMPDDIGHSVENESVTATNTTVATEEFTFDDDVSTPSTNSTDVPGKVAESSDPVAESGPGFSEGSTTDGELAATDGHDGQQPDPVKSEAADVHSHTPGTVDPFTTSVERLLNIGARVRVDKAYLKSLQDDVTAVKKRIKEGEERILILTEEMSYQLDLDPDNPGEFVNDDADDATAGSEEKTEDRETTADPEPQTEDATSDEEPTPGTNRKPRTVAVICDIRENDELLLAAGQIAEVAQLNGDDLMVYLSKDTDETIALNPGEYEVDEWQDVEDLGDDHSGTGEITWESLKLSDNNVSALFDIGIADPSDLAAKTINDLTAAAGIGPKKAEKILEAYVKASE